jgi:hypothetical protein
MKKLVSILLPVLLLSGCLTTPTATVPDLTGSWKANYPCCGDELVSVVQTGDNAVATKTKGDVYVPAGKITWRANVRTGVGESQVAFSGYTNPKFIPATLKIIDADTVKVVAPDSADADITYFRAK